MRRSLLVLSFLLSCILLGTGCWGTRFYECPRNWVIMNSEIPAYSSQYDVFYLYPSQKVHTSGPVLNWYQAGVTDSIRHYAENMTSELVPYHARIFSPFVPQLGFDSYLRLLDTRNKDPERFDYLNSELEPAIRHTVMALKYYLKHFNPDGERSFILLGQGQGAVILYEAMKQVSDIKPKNGFVAAYFQGLPGVTGKTVRDDFHYRGIVPATGRYDCGVVVLINTRLPGEPLKPVPDSGVINPLNWRTDNQPVPGKLNPNSLFYLHAYKRLHKIPQFCGAVLDPENGVVLLTDVPERHKFKLSERVFPSDVWGLFSASISRNADERVREHQFRHKLKTAR